MSFTDFLGDLGISSEAIATTVCVLLAAFVLTHYTRIRGLLGFAMNAVLLFAGAFGAVYISRGMDLRVGYFLERNLLVSFGGILVGSLLMLLLFPRSRQE